MYICSCQKFTAIANWQLKQKFGEIIQIGYLKLEKVILWTVWLLLFNKHLTILNKKENDPKISNQLENSPFIGDTNKCWEHLFSRPTWL